jgi:hypothetical protein
VIGGWRKLHNEGPHRLKSSSDIMRLIKSWRVNVLGHVARMEEVRNAYTISFRQSQEKRILGRPKQRRENNIKIGFKTRTWLIFFRIDSNGELLFNAAVNIQNP